MWNFAGLRKLLLRAHDPRVLYGAAEGVNESAVADACEEKLSNIKGPIFCLGPGSDQVWIFSCAQQTDCLQ
jgi:hypothetical protein